MADFGPVQYKTIEYEVQCNIIYLNRSYIKDRAIMFVAFKKEKGSLFLKLGSAQVCQTSSFSAAMYLTFTTVMQIHTFTTALLIFTFIICVEA